MRKESVGAGVGEERVVNFDVVGDDGDVGSKVVAEGSEEGGIGLWGVEGLAWGADYADGAEREEDGDGGGVAVDFFGEDMAELGALGG